MVNQRTEFASIFDEANHAWDAGDVRRAFVLFQAAAKAGEKDAFNSVGYFFDHGIGVKKNSATAYAWYRRAAVRGDLAGFLNLGTWFRDAGNLRRSKFWFEKAYAQGDGSAAYELGKLFASQHSSISIQRARQYLSTAVRSKFISEDEREEAKAMLSTLQGA